MARRTKAEAEQTRREIICAARRVFDERGVSRTTMEHIAAAAGVTRGAIYWHFASKAELFFAMREEARLPMFDRIDDFPESAQDPLAAVESFLLQSIELLEKDEVVRRTYQVIVSKCEYVDEFAAVLSQLTQCSRDYAEKLAAAYGRAMALGQLRPGSAPTLLAKDTLLFFYGMLRLWLADVEGGLLRPEIREVIRQHVNLRRAL